MKNILFLLALLAGGLLLPCQSMAQMPTDKQLQAIETLMAPTRKKITDLLEADKSGQYATYKADLEAIGKSKDPGERNELLVKLERDHIAFIRSHYKKVVVNHEEQRQQVARILGHNNFRFGEFADIQIDIIGPGVSLPDKFAVEFTCPMEVQDEKCNSVLATICEARASDCSMFCQTMSEIAGGSRAKADVGENFEIPGGSFTKVKVTTKTNISYYGFALAIAGYAQTNVKFGIRFRAPGTDKVVITREAMALAPLVWYSKIEGDQDDYVATATFTGTFNAGTTVTAQAHNEAFSIAVPVFGFLCLSTASTGEIDSIRLELSN